MTALEDKELAQEWVKNNTDESPDSFRGEELQEAFLAGRPKWHKVTDGDLPKNNTRVLVLLKNKQIRISIFMENKFTFWNKDHNTYTKLYDVIAWCEIPKYTEENLE